jgi:hypothetical protein
LKSLKWTFFRKGRWVAGSISISEESTMASEVAELAAGAELVAWNAGAARCAGTAWLGNIAWFMLGIDVSEIASGSRVAVVKILPFQSV